MAERDPYAVLGVPTTADQESIAAAHRDLARRHHPDVSRDPAAEQRMAEINAAWTLLRDPARRAQWDILNLPPHLRRRQTASTPAPGATPGSTQARPGSPAGGPAPAGRTAWRLGPDGEGAAGPPPGNPSGSVLDFGRHIGWSLGEVARYDPGYLAWLRERRDGARFKTEIDRLLEGHTVAARHRAEVVRRKRRLPFG